MVGYGELFFSMENGMNIGPLAPISSKAMTALDKIAKILNNTPRSEWEFVLLQGKEKAEQKIRDKRCGCSDSCFLESWPGGLP